MDTKADNENRQAIAPDAPKNPISELAAQAQWALLEEEYCIEPDPDGQLGKIKTSIIVAIQKGRVEVLEDPNEGVVIRQTLLRSPTKDGNRTLTYHAPDASHIATTGIGKEAERTNVMRWVSLAAAVTNTDEGAITRLKGGDRTTMETIAQLFLFA
jgi:hypothetical protein